MLSNYLMPSIAQGSVRTAPPPNYAEYGAWTSKVKTWTFDDSNPYIDCGHGGDFIIGQGANAPVKSTTEVYSGQYSILLGNQGQSYLWIPHYAPIISSMELHVFVTGSSANPWIWLGDFEDCTASIEYRGGYSISSGSITPGNWHDVLLVDNYPNQLGTFDVWVDGVKQPQTAYNNVYYYYQRGFGYNPPYHLMSNSFCIEVPESCTDRLYIDDVTITTYDDPQTLYPNGFWVNQDTQFSLFAYGAQVQTYYKLPSMSSFASYTTPFTLAGENEGSCTIQYYSTSVGYQEPTKTLKVNLDKTAPTSEILPSTGQVSPTQQFTLSSSDGMGQSGAESQLVMSSAESQQVTINSKNSYSYGSGIYFYYTGMTLDYGIWYAKYTQPFCLNGHLADGTSPTYRNVANTYSCQLQQAPSGTVDIYYFSVDVAGNVESQHHINVTLS